VGHPRKAQRVVLIVGGSSRSIVRVRLGEVVEDHGGDFAGRRLVGSSKAEIGSGLTRECADQPSVLVPT
jgi:hypothetical protein